VTQPINSGKGLIEGVEVNESTFFDFAPGILRNFGVAADYTFVKSKEDLPATPASVAFTGQVEGVSKNTFNAALFYDDGKFRGRVEYNWRSGYVLDYDLTNPRDNLDWYPISQLDASATYQFTRNLSVTVDGTNLLAIPQRAYWGTKATADRVYFQGRVYSAALRFKF